MKRDSNRIQPRVLNQLDITFGDVSAPVLFPKLVGCTGSDQFVKERFDFPRRLRSSFKQEHVSFGLEPVP